MIKRFSVFVILLMVLFFTTGCPARSSEPVAPPVLDPIKVQPPKAQPPQTEPPESKFEIFPVQQDYSEKTELDLSSPEKTEPDLPEPEIVESEISEPNLPEPNDLKPETIESEQLEPEQIEAEETESEKTSFAQDKPKDSEPETPEPQEAEPAQTEKSSIELLYDSCADILNNFVKDNGTVNYRTLKRKKSNLRNLLTEFARLAPEEYDTWSKEDKVAFWINAYNIKMLTIIVDNYPIEGTRWLNPIWGPHSIRHINRKIDGFDGQKLIVIDEEFTLSDIEQRLFYKEFNDPRALLALSLASVSSPALRNKPYTGKDLDKQLNDQIKKFLSTPRAFMIDRERKKVHLSAIFDPDWYGEYFDLKYGTDKKFKSQRSSVRAVLNFITGYISEQDVYFLETENYSIKYIKYNWTINH